MGLFIPSKGPMGEIFPRDLARGFSPDELRDLIECEVLKIHEIFDGRRMVVDAQGRAKGLPANLRATVFYSQNRGTGFAIVGNVVLCFHSELQL